MPNDESMPKPPADTSRRDFLGRALAAGAGLTIGAALTNEPAVVEAQSAPACIPAGQTLAKIEEIGTPKKGVQAIIKIVNENKAYWGASKTGGAPVCQTGQMRYFTGAGADGK